MPPGKSYFDPKEWLEKIQKLIPVIDDAMFFLYTQIFHCMFNF